jgi:hypothetical protein
MKNQIVAILGLTLLAAVSASAQTTKTNPMKVPVAFMAGEKALPAGEYLVQFNIDSGAIVLLNEAGPVASMITSHDGQGNGQDALEFRLVGDTWVLQRVSVNGRELKLVPSKFEKMELAKLKSPSDETLIASSAPGR